MQLQKDEVYLNLMLEYIPETVYKVARQYAKSKQTIPINFIRVGVPFRLINDTMQHIKFTFDQSSSNQSNVIFLLFRLIALHVSVV